ncbi:hypothetical protein [Microbulbifer elongatus]|uniref:hypothetical protein n=1 Tax=Microbulbifer elongatus TaxID=86173 RepID=UPI001E2E37D9|nr:hypothetical protein [Microbulbifer elongatus]
MKEEWKVIENERVFSHIPVRLNYRKKPPDGGKKNTVNQFKKIGQSGENILS